MPRTKIQAIFGCKCPRCREGSLFENPPVLYKKFGKMPVTCKVCGLRFEKEPGFFFGAMYISYFLSVGVVLALAVLLRYFGGNPEPGVYVLASLLPLLLLYPLIFQQSRSIYLYLIRGLEGGSDF